MGVFSYEKNLICQALTFAEKTADKALTTVGNAADKVQFVARTLNKKWLATYQLKLCSFHNRFKQKVLHF